LAFTRASTMRSRWLARRMISIASTGSFIYRKNKNPFQGEKRGWTAVIWLSAWFHLRYESVPRSNSSLKRQVRNNDDWGPGDEAEAARRQA
jgi:hypothetical protein